jgi:hypothetical protein
VDGRARLNKVSPLVQLAEIATTAERVWPGAPAEADGKLIQSANVDHILIDAFARRKRARRLRIIGHGDAKVRAREGSSALDGNSGVSAKDTRPSTPTALPSSDWARSIVNGGGVPVLFRRSVAVTSPTG